MTGTRPLIVSMLACLMLLLASPYAKAQEMVSVARPEIHMRAGAGTEHTSLWMLGQGYPLQVIGRRGQWLRVRDFEKDVGWVYRPLTSTRPHHVVNAPVVNLRKGPGPQHDVVGQATHGNVLRTLEKRRDWVRVQHENGTTGWAARRLLWGW
jgi:SH3-like domain-containing protein